jgi:hypothetical protein
MNHKGTPLSVMKKEKNKEQKEMKRQKENGKAKVLLEVFHFASCFSISV